jgi:hypothetical protein
LQEYSELTTKLHDLEKKEQDLKEQIVVDSSKDSSPMIPSASLHYRSADDNFIAQSLASGMESVMVNSVV